MEKARSAGAVEILQPPHADEERPSLDARSEGQSGHPAEERIRKNDRTECSVNAPGGIAQSEKVECPCLFLGAAPAFERRLSPFPINDPSYESCKSSSP